MKPVAHMESDFPTKFGIPRQAGLVKSLTATVVFEPEYRHPEALRGIEGFSHLWLIWEFSEAKRQSWSPTVRPPRLGGNARMGVFATRSPFRPNPIGLSCVKLEGVEVTAEKGTVLHVSGADLMDGTPIFDIKPYVPYADAHPEASSGFTAALPDATLNVVFPDEWRYLFTAEQQAAIIGILERDPRPHYHDDPDRVYGMTFAGYNVRFRVQGSSATVCGAEKI